MKHFLSITIIILLSYQNLQAQNKIGIGTTTPTHQLHTTQGVRHQNLSGIGSGFVMTDSSGVLYRQPFNATDSSIATVGSSIPDSSCTGIISTITVSGWPTNVNPINIGLKINITHPYTADLYFYLISPFNDTLLLAYGNGVSNDFTNTVFTDYSVQGLSYGSNPFSSNFAPFNYVGSIPDCNTENTTIANFASINGGIDFDPNGNWKLVVKDLDFYNSFFGPPIPVTNDTGSLVNWSLMLFKPLDPNMNTNNGFYTKWQMGQLSNTSSIQDVNGDLVMGNTNNILLNGNGNVGVGTPNPITRLQVIGSGGFASSNVAVLGQNNNSSDISNPGVRYSEGRLGDYDGIPFLSQTDAGVWGNAYNDWDVSSNVNGYGGVFSSTDSLGLVEKYVLLGGTLTNPAAAFMGGNVGIGTINPQHQLNIGTTTTDFQTLSIRGYSNSPTFWKGGAAFGYNTASVILGENAGVAQIGGHNADLSSWSDLAINVGGGNVGIGTSTPSTKLDVAGTTRTNDLLVTNNITTSGIATANLGGAGVGISSPLQISSGTPGAGKVLTSDALGNANWQTPAAPVETDPQVGLLTNNYVPRWNTGSGALINGVIQDNGTSVSVGNALPLSTIYQLSANRMQVTANGDGQSTLFGYRTRDNQNDGTGYSQIAANDATRGYNFWGDLYTFGVGGWNYNDYSRCGGTFGSEVSGTYWGSLGYRSSGLLNYGVYGSAAYASGGGFLPTGEVNGVGGGFFGAIGSVSKGSVAGQLNEGELFATYNKGDVYTSGKTVELTTTADEKVIASYAVTATEQTVYNKGKINLVNGEAVVTFHENYTGILLEAPIVTASPMGNCNGVYITNVTKNGFTIKELNNGNNNIEISWIAVGNKITSNNEVPTMFTNKDFNRNLSEALFNDGDTKHSGKSMWWNGSEIKFGTMPSSLNPPIDIEKKKSLEEQMKNQQ